MSEQHARQSAKVFIGGLSWETSSEKLRQYFENYGVVREAFVSYNRNNGRPRGFGFVVFESPEVADKVVATKHTIDRREVEAKKAVPKDEQMSAEHGGGPGGGHGAGSSGGDGSGGHGAGGGPSTSTKSRKVFVGGLAPSVDEAALRQHFEQFGAVEDAVVMYDHDNKRPRGFGFVTFASEEALELVFAKGAMQTIQDKQIEIKSAVPRDQMPMAAPRGHGYGGGPGAAFDPRYAAAAGGLYNPYMPHGGGLPSQFAGMGGGRVGGGYGGHRGMVPTAAGPPGGGRAPGRFDPGASGLLQPNFLQQGQGQFSQGLGGGGGGMGKMPPMAGGYGALYGPGGALANGSGAAGAGAGMFGPSSQAQAALAYNLASLQQAQAQLNGLHAAAGGAPGQQGGPGGGPGKLGGGPGGAGAGGFGGPSSAASSLTSLKALALASGLGAAFPAGAGPGQGDGSGGDAASAAAAAAAAAYAAQQPSDSSYADAAAAVNAAAAAGLAAADYGSYRDSSSFSTAPAPGWSS